MDHKPKNLGRASRWTTIAVWGLLLMASVFYAVKYGVELTRLVSENSTTPPHRGLVRIGVFNWPGYYPIIVADELGLFKKYGVDVELVEGKTIGELNDWVRTGRTQVTLGVLADFIVLRSLGAPIQMMIAIDYSMADVIMGRPEIRKPKDLKGKRIGLAELNSFGEYFVMRSLELSGVNPRTVQLRTVPTDRVPTAILNGEIDAGHTWDPALSEGLKRGLIPILSSAENPQLVIEGIAFRREVTYDSDVPTAIGRAYFEALQLYKTDPTKFAAIAGKRFKIAPEVAHRFVDGDVKYIDLDENVDLYSPSGLLRKEALNIAQFFDERGMGSDLVDVAKLIDDSIIRRLEAERASSLRRRDQ